MSEQTKPKEFYFDFKIGDNQSVSQDTTVWCIKNGKHDFHTIEKSAFDAQALEIEKLKSENDSLKQATIMFKASAESALSEMKSHDFTQKISKQAWIDMQLKFESRLEKLRHAVKIVEYTDRSRGYPTSGEWAEVVKLAKQALAEDAKLESESGE